MTLSSAAAVIVVPLSGSRLAGPRRCSSPRVCEEAKRPAYSPAAASGWHLGRKGAVFAAIKRLYKRMTTSGIDRHYGLCGETTAVRDTILR